MSLDRRTYSPTALGDVLRLDSAAPHVITGPSIKTGMAKNGGTHTITVRWTDGHETTIEPGETGAVPIID